MWARPPWAAVGGPLVLILVYKYVLKRARSARNTRVEARARRDERAGEARLRWKNGGRAHLPSISISLQAEGRKTSGLRGEKKSRLHMLESPLRAKHTDR